MSSPPEQMQPSTPTLTPSFCLTPTSLSAFLSRARALVDDPIGQHLSALSSPSSRPFTSPDFGRTPSTSRLPSVSCLAFVSNTLTPAWNERDRVLQYCTGVADAVVGGTIDPPLPEPLQDEPDERLDPYSARARYQKPESDVEVLRRVLIAERGIEDVVRKRTWSVIRDRCIGVNGDWRETMLKLSQGR